MNQAHPTSLSPVILGLESSCDETAAAILRGEGDIASSVLCSQHEVHGRYGGVVPELAARRHIETVEAVVAEAMRQAGTDWSDLHAVAVTQGPGLAGALLVGVSFAKALAYAMNIPLIGVNHLEGHMASAWIDQPDFPLPCVGLVVSGGHTHLYRANEDGSYMLLGQTLDDAAGEAFDKAAKMLDLGYPGGPAIDRLAASGDPRAVRFPRPYLKKQGTLDFSFSGLKTALLYYLRDLDWNGQSRPVADIAAGFQEAIVEVLVEKAFKAVERQRVEALAVVGGVSANTRLRAMLSARAAKEGIRLALPPLVYCTDNAAMIAAAGRWKYLQGQFASGFLEAEADLSFPALDLAQPASARTGSKKTGRKATLAQRG